MADSLTPEDVDMLEAYDRIEPIGIRGPAKALAFIAAALAQFFGDKEAKMETWWPEEKQEQRPVTSKEAIDMLRASYGGS